MDIDERRQACLFAGAIGDAMGFEVELNNLATIQHRFGPQGIQEPVFHDGKLVVSDDTQMTLFTLEAILDCDADAGQDAVIQRIHQAYLDWYNTQIPEAATSQYTGTIGKSPILHKQRAPGKTCMTALREGGMGTLDTPINDSKGCGGVMRVAPVGLFPERWSVDEVFDIGIRSSAITHTHPSGYLSTGTMAVILRLLLEGLDLHEAVLESLKYLMRYDGFEEVESKITLALELAQSDRSPVDAIEAIGQGWVGDETLAIGIYAAFEGRDYLHSIAMAANHTGDSDSTASIAGQLYGAWHGFSDIPQEWVEALDVYGIFKQLLT